MTMTDEQQTETVETIRERLMSIITCANTALECIGSDPCTDALNDILRDAEFAQDANDTLTT
jgi:hypothetical protein